MAAAFLVTPMNAMDRPTAPLQTALAAVSPDVAPHAEHRRDADTSAGALALLGIVVACVLVARQGV
jgi:hypothetical protein